ncbi:recombinase family protein [Novosphingobium tardum]|uniref:Recombinase family protein n=1 Tax=Novosphingobium tardum TaxID=1538021 RepID=A0ABV8RLG9_9SPHN
MKAVAYYRVSTAAQGRSGLGLEAQRRAVTELCATRGLSLIAEFTEVESGKNNDRPQLSEALRRATLAGAVLVVAKLDRLSRNAAFTLSLRDSGVDFICADNPEVNRLTIGVLAVINEDARERISENTKAALAAAKARGTRLGNPNGAAALRRAGKGNSASLVARKRAADARCAALAKDIALLRAEGAESLRDLARGLNGLGIEAPRGGAWHPVGVQRLLQRIAALSG